MRADRNQANIAMAFASRFMIRLNHAESSIFTRGTGVGLQRTGVEAGYPAEVCLQFLRNMIQSKER